MQIDVNMIEIPGTSYQAKDPAHVAQFTRLLAPMTAPVFEAEHSTGTDFTEVVAVAYRDEAGALVHGGLFGFGPGGVKSIALKDQAGEVDTSEDPKHVAIGMVMMRGPLVFRQGGRDQIMPLSIVDLQADKLQEPLRRSTPAREAVVAAYLSTALPGTHHSAKKVMPGHDGSAMNPNTEWEWIGSVEKSVAFGPAGLKMAIRFGNEVTTFAEVEKRLLDGEMGDDLPCVMEGFGVNYDAACDAVFSKSLQKAVALLRQAQQMDTTQIERALLQTNVAVTDVVELQPLGKTEVSMKCQTNIPDGVTKPRGPRP